MKLKESLLVAFFLVGLVVLGGLQRWWLEPLIRHLDTLPLFLGATVLTAFADKAASLTSSQISQVSAAFKYVLVAGAVAGWVDRGCECPESGEILHSPRSLFRRESAPPDWLPVPHL